MKFREFVEILEDEGFRCIRTEGSHRRYEGWVNGMRQLVTVAYHRGNDDILRETLASMIRQSGLPKRRFR